MGPLCERLDGITLFQFVLCEGCSAGGSVSTVVHDRLSAAWIDPTGTHMQDDRTGAIESDPGVGSIHF